MSTAFTLPDEADLAYKRTQDYGAHLDELARQAVAANVPIPAANDGANFGPPTPQIAAPPESNIPITGADPAAPGAPLAPVAPAPNPVPDGGAGGFPPTSPTFQAMQKLGMLGAHQNSADERAMGAAVADQQGANADAGMHQAAALQQQAAADAQAMQVAGTHDAAQAKVDNARNAFMDQQMQQVTQMTDQLASSKINPDHYWNSRTTGQKIGAGIATFLSGLGNALVGSKETPLKLINGEIDKDIAAQQASADNLKSGIAARQTLIGMARQNFSDRTQQNAAAKIAALDQVQRKVNNLGMYAKGQDVADRVGQLNSALDVQKQQELQKLHQVGYQQASTMLGQMATLEQSQNAAAAAQAKTKDGGGDMVVGYSGTLPKGRPGAKVRAEIQNVAQIKQLLGEVQQYHEHHGGVTGVLGGGALAAIRAKEAILRRKLSDHLGIPPETVESELLPDVTSRGFNKARFAATLDAVNSQHAAGLGAYGMGIDPNQKLARNGADGGSDSGGDAEAGH